MSERNTCSAPPKVGQETFGYWFLLGAGPPSRRRGPKPRFQSGGYADQFLKATNEPTDPRTACTTSPPTASHQRRLDGSYRQLPIFPRQVPQVTWATLVDTYPSFHSLFWLTKPGDPGRLRGVRSTGFPWIFGSSFERASKIFYKLSRMDLCEHCYMFAVITNTQIPG
jgi:hypothetical protein